MKLLKELFQYVISISSKYNIDESHSLGHSMRVFQFANKIALEEPLYKLHPVELMEHRPIIYAASILHDTCDRKYRDEEKSLIELRTFLSDKMTEEDISATIGIIETMSYSKIKKYGMPDLGIYQTAFNVVREADLLDAYDFDRSMIYHMNHNNESIEEAYENAKTLFENRIFRHMEDGLLLTNYAIHNHPRLSHNALLRIKSWENSIRMA